MDDSPRTSGLAVNFRRIPTPDHGFFPICAGAIAYEVERQYRDISMALHLGVYHVVTIDVNLALDRRLSHLDRIKAVNPLVLHRVEICHLGRGYCESFNGKLRDEFLNGEIFYSLKKAQILTERWRVEYNTERPHSALGYTPPAPQAILPKQEGHGDVENNERFPHLHTPGYGYGQRSKEALH